jgi:hypothetical protein
VDRFADREPLAMSFSRVCVGQRQLLIQSPAAGLLDFRLRGGRSWSIAIAAL